MGYCTEAFGKLLDEGMKEYYESKSNSDEDGGGSSDEDGGGSSDEDC